MNMDYQGRIALVAGGSGELGMAVIRGLLSRGATVHATASPRGGPARMPLADHVTWHVVDLRDEAAVSRLYQSLGELWASIHVAGAFAMSRIERTGADDLRKMFELNTLTSFLCCREAVIAMRNRGSAASTEHRGGRIVNVAARPAVTPAAGMIAYAASKAAVVSITQSLAEEVKGDRILVNAVLPSIMDTPANRAAMPNADYDAWPKVDEVADAILYLSSTGNALTSGACVPVYGRQ